MVMMICRTKRGNNVLEDFYSSNKMFNKMNTEYYLEVFKLTRIIVYLKTCVNNMWGFKVDLTGVQNCANQPEVILDTSKTFSILKTGEKKPKMKKKKKNIKTKKSLKKRKGGKNGK